MEFLSRKIVMSAHLNAQGKLFGGQCLAWIDEESAIAVLWILNHRTGASKPSIVTKCISQIDFKAPGCLGDIVEIGTEIVSIGTTSITVSCTVRNMTSRQTIVSVDKIVFVNVDTQGNPTPHGCYK